MSPKPHRTTRAALVTLPLAALLALGTAACSEDSQPQDLRDAASSAQSALDRAGKEFDDIKNGADAKNDVKAGAVQIDGDGRATTQVTATNTGSSSADFLVQVEFRNADGGLADTVVLTIKDVPAGQTGTGTARSNRDLPATVTATVPRALRH